MKYEAPQIIDLKRLSNAGTGDEPDACSVGKGPPVPICSNGNCDANGCSDGTWPGGQPWNCCATGNGPDIACCCSGIGPTTGCGMSPT